MKILKPKFWQNEINVFSILLFPLTIIYYVLINLRKIVSLPKKFDIPIICIGNIYVGGTGKTPLSVLIADQLKSNKKPAIIKKYYKNHIDEHNLIKSKIDCLILNKSRIKAINEAIKKNYDVLILDDGFQDYSFKKKLNIICFNSNQLVGNGMLFPSGPLRDSMNSLKEANFVIINGPKNFKFEEKILSVSKEIKIFYSKYLPLNLNQFKNKKLLAFSGIGNNENFFEMLEDNHLNVKEKLAFPDHYTFNKNELNQIIKRSIKNGYDIVTTEKDYFRIKDYGFKEIKYLKLELEILKKDKLINQIIKLL